MKDFTVTERGKLQKLGQKVLDQIHGDITDEYLQLYTAHEELKIENAALRASSEKFKQDNRILTEQLAGLRTWAQWDQQMHDRFAAEVIDHSLKYEDFIRIEQETAYKEEHLTKAAYFATLAHQTPAEKSHLDLSAPFSLFGGHLRLAFSERLNIMERETFGLLRRKLRDLEGLQKLLADGKLTLADI